MARPVNRAVNLGLAVSNANIGSVDLPNVITNAGSGVGILVGSGSNNTVAFNRFAAISSPIDLAAAGGVLTANDLNDADSGPNGLQNFPVIQSVQRISGGLRVQGTLDVPVATNNLPYILSFYASSSCAASGNGAGGVTAQPASAAQASKVGQKPRRASSHGNSKNIGSVGSTYQKMYHM
mgnify:CR=1 FL=1